MVNQKRLQNTDLNLCYILMSNFDFTTRLQKNYSVFQEFSQAKFANGGLILRSSQFLILPQLPQKMKLASKVVKIDLKIIVSLPKI